MLARAGERRQRLVDGGTGGDLRRMALGVEWQIGWSAEGHARQRDGPEHVGPDESAPGSNRGAEIVRDRAVAERRDQPERVTGISWTVGGRSGKSARVMIRRQPAMSKDLVAERSIARSTMSTDCLLN
jgi:hypothetical protein